MAKHPRPQNLTAQKVEINSEVLSSISSLAKNRDAKLKAVQGGLARATVPAVKIAEAAMNNDIDRKQMLDLAVDTVTLLSNANAVINQVRGDALSPICNIPARNCAESRKEMTQQSCSSATNYKTALKQPRKAVDWGEGDNTNPTLLATLVGDELEVSTLTWCHGATAGHDLF